jgi:multisubunit Na+/H+ antiporter MnhB subunit
MTNSLLRFRHTGSFIAGLLIGISVVVSALAMGADPSNGQTLWVFSAPFIFALGLTLQVLVGAKQQHRCTTDAEAGASPIGFPGLGHER